jgi:hypothetical protein
MGRSVYLYPTHSPTTLASYHQNELGNKHSSYQLILKFSPVSCSNKTPDGVLFEQETNLGDFFLKLTISLDIIFNFFTGVDDGSVITSTKFFSNRWI